MRQAGQVAVGDLPDLDGVEGGFGGHPSLPSGFTLPETHPANLALLHFAARTFI